MKVERIGLVSSVALLAAFLLVGPAARGDALMFSTPTQTAVAQDDLNTDSHTKPGFGMNSATTMDGDGFSGFGSADVSQSVSFDSSTRTVAAHADVSASATGGQFGGDFSASARATYSVLFTLTGPQDVIFTDSGGESALTGPNSTDIPPGTALLQPGDYTLGGSALALALGSNGDSQTRTGSFDVSLKFVILGDANQDGTVNFSDLLILAQNYGKQNATLAEGDFNLDGTVGFADLLLLAQDYGQTSMPTALSAVPEPAAVGLLLLAAAGLRRRL
jgi:hypothetical protein